VCKEPQNGVKRNVLHIISSPKNLLSYVIKDDPIRPEIPLEERVNGNQIIKQTSQWIKNCHERIDTFVTYSPKNEVAKAFHLKNGASIYRKNPDSVNYIYNCKR